MTAIPSSMRAAGELLSVLVEQGVRHVVYCPGSRCAPFAPLLDIADVSAVLDVRVVVDERSAGFIALGMSKASLLEAQDICGHPMASAAPTAVIVTSGTAVANLHPAVLEADAAGVPLLVISADRPHEMVGTGASQTTEQTGIFGRALREMVDVPADLLPALQSPAHPQAVAPHSAAIDVSVDTAVHALRGMARRAVDAASGRLSHDPGPAQINLRLRPPLFLPERPASAAELMSWEASPRESADLGVSDRFLVDWGQRAQCAQLRALALPSSVPSGMFSEQLAAELPVASIGRGDDAEAPRAPSGQRGLIIAADSPHALGPLAMELAARLNWPVLAEPSSGARACQQSVEYYPPLLATEPGRVLLEEATDVLLLGHPTLSRAITALLSDANRRIHVLTATARPSNLGGVNGEQLLVSSAQGSIEQSAQGVIVRLGLEPAEPTWVAEWQHEAAALRRRSAAAASASSKLAREVCLQTWTEVAARSPLDEGRGRILVVGSSMAIRHLDQLAPISGPAPTVLASRGLAGIDGTLATAIGLWHVLREPITVLLGDLAFQHDLGSLLDGEQEERPDLRIVVLDDAGGAIFSTLEYPRAVDAETMERFFTTPQRLSRWELTQALTTQKGDLARQARSPEDVQAFFEECERLAEEEASFVSGGIHILHVPLT